MRSFKTAFPPDLLQSVQAGTMAYAYKGVPCLKNPFDLAIYLKLIWDLKPKSLIEIGSKQGGGALWFADMLSIAGLGCPVISIDRVPPNGFADPRIAFLAGDAARLGDTLTPEMRAALPHPWLVVEDSAHTYEVTLAALRFFADTTIAGDIVIIEDGVVDDLGMSAAYGGGPNRAVAEFLEASPGTFRLLTQYCDMFGVNATYNPNAYFLRL
ncbi:MAG TPA: CmcI family methyltransferase [Stellaceae bacterium]|nr:CmcI family methyltransferase [Stellaceae bacterium]